MKNPTFLFRLFLFLQAPLFQSLLSLRNKRSHRNERAVSKKEGGVSDLDTVILNLEDSQHVKSTYVHIWNTTRV